MVFVQKKKEKDFLLLLTILVLFLLLELFGISLFGNTTIGLLLFCTHLLSCLTVGILFRFWKYKSSTKVAKISSYSQNKKSPPTFNNLGGILQNSIMTSINTVVMIGGFVMLFSVIISILNNTGIFDLLASIFSPILSVFHLPASFANGIFAGIVELTNGVSIISNIPMKAISINIIVCAFLLGFGGISILLQVLSITSSSDISIKPYIIGKLMQGFIASFYTYIFINNFTFFNLDI